MFSGPEAHGLCHVHRVHVCSIATRHRGSRPVAALNYYSTLLQYRPDAIG